MQVEKVSGLGCRGLWEATAGRKPCTCRTGPASGGDGPWLWSPGRPAARLILFQASGRQCGATPSPGLINDQPVDGGRGRGGQTLSLAAPGPEGLMGRGLLLEGTAAAASIWVTGRPRGCEVDPGAEHGGRVARWHSPGTLSGSCRHFPVQWPRGRGRPLSEGQQDRHSLRGLRAWAGQHRGRARAHLGLWGPAGARACRAAVCAQGAVLRSLVPKSPERHQLELLPRGTPMAELSVNRTVPVLPRALLSPSCSTLGPGAPERRRSVRPMGDGGTRDGVGPRDWRQSPPWVVWGYLQAEAMSSETGQRLLAPWRL